ncbi:MAG: translation initiation factor IF-6 [Candidatus Nanohaloarchaea archaeon]
MEIERYNYRGDANIGFYATLTDSYAILPRDFEMKDLVPQKMVETRISGTNLAGLFTAGNSNCLLVPGSIKEREIERIQEAGIDYQVLETVENALGNVILANDRGAYISEELEEQSKEIESALGVEVFSGKIAGITNTGVCGVANSRGALIHRDAAEEEAKAVKKALGVENVGIGSVNMGSPYVGSGILLNNSTILVGEDTTGPELGRIDRTLRA